MRREEKRSVKLVEIKLPRFLRTRVGGGGGEGGKEGRRVWEKVSFPFDSLVAELFRFVPPGTDKEKAEKEGKSEARFRGEREIAVFIDSKSIDSRASESRAKY